MGGGGGQRMNTSQPKILIDTRRKPPHDLRRNEKNISKRKRSKNRARVGKDRQATREGGSGSIVNLKFYLSFTPTQLLRHHSLTT